METLRALRIQQRHVAPVPRSPVLLSKQSAQPGCCLFLEQLFQSSPGSLLLEQPHFAPRGKARDSWQINLLQGSLQAENMTRMVPKGAPDCWPHASRCCAHTGEHTLGTGCWHPALGELLQEAAVHISPFSFWLSHWENTKYSGDVSGPLENVLVMSQSQELLPGTDEFGNGGAGNFRKRWNYWLLADVESFIWVLTFYNHRRAMQFIKNTFKYMTGGCLSETYMCSKSLYLKDLSYGRYSAYGS